MKFICLLKESNNRKGRGGFGIGRVCESQNVEEQFWWPSTLLKWFGGGDCVIILISIGFETTHRYWSHFVFAVSDLRMLARWLTTRVTVSLLLTSLYNEVRILDLTMVGIMLQISTRSFNSLSRLRGLLDTLIFQTMGSCSL